MQEEQAMDTTGSAGPDQLTDLKDSIDGLARLLDQLSDARIAARRTRIGVIIVMLLVILGYGYFMFRNGMRFYKEKVPTFVAEVQGQSVQMAYDKAPDLVRRGKILAIVYRDELQKQLQERAPELKEAFIKETDTLTGNLADMCEAKIDAKLNAMAERQKDRVMEAFPRLTDDTTRDVVMENLETAFHGATLDLLQDRVNEAEARLRGIYDKILQFLPEDDREGHQDRMRKAWEDFLLWDMEGMKQSGE